MTALLVDGNKVCRLCGESKSLTDFGSRPANRDGRDGTCLACAAARRRADRAAHPERHRENDRRYYARNKRKVQDYNLKKLYGLTIEQYEAMLVEQGGVCALCRKPPSGRANGGRLHVDHDHETGRVRRLLCYHCNNALGHFRDDPDLMRRAADYIEEFR